VIIDLAPSSDGSEVNFTLRAEGASVLRLLKSQARKNNERTVRNLAELAAAVV
jgi:hypothetical protein